VLLIQQKNLLEDLSIPANKKAMQNQQSLGKSLLCIQKTNNRKALRKN